MKQHTKKKNLYKYNKQERAKFGSWHVKSTTGLCQIVHTPTGIKKNIALEFKIKEKKNIIKNLKINISRYTNAPLP